MAWMPATSVSSASSTTMPRLTAMPASRARSALGRMPMATTTASASMVRPSFKVTPSTRDVPAISAVSALRMHLDAHGLDRTLQHARSLGIELALHQPVHQVQHGDACAGLRETVRGLKSEQPAADHHDAVARACTMPDGPDVVDVAERDDAGQRHAGERRPDRLRTGREHQLREGKRVAVRQAHAARMRVDRSRRGSRSAA